MNARATWTAGDFGRIAMSYAGGSAELVARLSLSPGERVLDVACGTGNTALPAARAGAVVTCLDIAPNLLAQARAAAEEEGVTATFDEGDCERLPYASESFDVVLSTFGAMFAAHPEQVASELVRVSRPGSRIVMANWTTEGFIGAMVRATAAYAPPPADVASPLLWGDERVVRDRLGGRVAALRCTRRRIALEYPFSPATVVEYFRAYYGPTILAFEATDPTRRDGLRHALEELWVSYNRGRLGETRVEAEYLEVVAAVW